jgi:hypothetical protein
MLCNLAVRLAPDGSYMLRVKIGVVSFVVDSDVTVTEGPVRVGRAPFDLLQFKLASKDETVSEREKRRSQIPSRLTSSL